MRRLVIGGMTLLSVCLMAACSIGFEDSTHASEERAHAKGFQVLGTNDHGVAVRIGTRCTGAFTAWTNDIDEIGVVYNSNGEPILVDSRRATGPDQFKGDPQTASCYKK